LKERGLLERSRYGRVGGKVVKVDKIRKSGTQLDSIGSSNLAAAASRRTLVIRNPV